MATTKQSTTSLALREAEQILHLRRKTNRQYHKPKMQISLAIVAGLIPPGVRAWAQFQAGGIQAAGESLSRDFTGYNPANNTWSLGSLKAGLLPLIAGILVHKVANKFGVNRAIGRTGLPFIRI